MAPLACDSLVIIVAQQGTLSIGAGTAAKFRRPTTGCGLFTTLDDVAVQSGNDRIRTGVTPDEGTYFFKVWNMSAIGLSRGKGFKMSAHADYSHDHLVFARQQSHALRALDWEDRVPPKSWSACWRPG
jgi:hypothetical protein